MTQKIAVALVHGIGNQTAESSERMGSFLMQRCQVIDPEAEIVFKPVFWAPVMQTQAAKLKQRMGDADVDVVGLWRSLLIDFVGDALAYQPTPIGHQIYDGIHRAFADALRHLAEEAGPTAPLTIVAHSLGTVIASNYIYDLQQDSLLRRLIPNAVREAMTGTPLELGETLVSFYTMGSPLPIWSLRYGHFGAPVMIPSHKLGRHYAGLSGEWVNFYDKDDVIGFPLKAINDVYNVAVTQDREVNVGNASTSRTPFSHLGYWRDSDVIDPIAQALCKTWRSVNGISDEEKAPAPDESETEK